MSVPQNTNESTNPNAASQNNAFAQQFQTLMSLSPEQQQLYFQYYANCAPQFQAYFMQYYQMYAQSAGINIQQSTTANATKANEPGKDDSLTKLTLRPISVEHETSMSSNKEPWPLSLRSYTVRAIDICTNDKERAFMSNKLKEIIKNVGDRDELNTYDWDNEPLPSLLSSEVENIPDPIDDFYDSNVLTAQLMKVDGNSSRFVDYNAIAGKVRNFFRSMPKRKLFVLIGELHHEIPFLPPQNFTGSSLLLEKQYRAFLRTEVPKASEVRGKETLLESFQMILARYQRTNNYTFFKEQFRNIRQDLAVQAIEDTFTLKVYETNIRISLKHYDFQEFENCQSRLWELTSKLQSTYPKPEFVAYKILHSYLFQLDSNLTSHVLTCFPKHLKSNPVVDHAIQCLIAFHTTNYETFFRLYGLSPNYTAFLLDRAVEELRLKSLQLICNSSYPHFPLADLADLLGFESTFAIEHFIRDLLERNKITIDCISKESNGKTYLLSKEGKSALFACKL